MIKKIQKTDAEWKKILTPEQYNILRKKGTEAPGSCSLLRNKEKGVYACVGCGNKLFKSSEKFDSGTGWPSFFEPYSDEALEYHEDNSWGMKRVEVLCAKCGGHLGHVFDDGSAPTFKRFCINGIVLKFKEL
ncbi:Peptide methionine sulfoxide reductase MsrB [uncultured archaeon]|nr:Peptide methionine sulfoxide reductase MsrB [uncultured archaeon]